MLHGLRMLSGKPAGAIAQVLRGGVLAPNAPGWRTVYTSSEDRLREEPGFPGPDDIEPDPIPIDELVVGETYVGTVTSIKPFGAFVDIGSTTDGLVHISEIANEYVRDVKDFVSVDEDIDVVLLKVVGNKLSLSRKAMFKEAGDASYTPAKSSRVTRNGKR